MRSDRPVVTLVTASDRPGAAANNECRWLAAAFAELAVRCDAVYLDGPRGIVERGSVREIRLGSGKARSSVAALVSYLRQARPGVTIVWPSHLGPFAVVAGALARQPVVPWEVTILSLDLGDGSDWPLSQRLVPRLQRLTYPLAAGVAANSADVADELARRVSRRRIVVLPNPVDVEGVRAAGSPKAQRSGRFRFCAVGRLASQKGYDVMLDALALADQRLPPDWELLVLGNGPRREELGAQARRLGLDERVSFLGHDENPYPLMASADAFVHAARWEGSPVVLKEALALELPVVAAAGLGGQREILDGGRYGLLVAPEDADALAAGLVRIAGDESLRLELSSRALEGARRYAATAIAQRMIRLASELGRRN